MKSLLFGGSWYIFTKSGSTILSCTGTDKPAGLHWLQHSTGVHRSLPGVRACFCPHTMGGSCLLRSVSSKSQAQNCGGRTAQIGVTLPGDEPWTWPNSRTPNRPPSPGLHNCWHNQFCLSPAQLHRPTLPGQPLCRPSLDGARAALAKASATASTSVGVLALMRGYHSVPPGRHY